MTRRFTRLIERLFLFAFVVALFLAAGAITAVFSGWWSPFAGALGPDYRLFDPETEPRDLADILRNLSFFLAGIVGALFGLFQLYNAARRTRISEDTSRTGFEAERNERFVKASGLLGNDDPAVQMAGVAALERLGMEPGANYADTAIEVLVSFVRNLTGPEAQARYRAERGAEAAITPDDQESAQEDGDADPEAPSSGPDRPTEPVFAAIRALSRLSHIEEQINETDRRGRLVDLRSCWLHGLDFPNAVMQSWRLQNANLACADLKGANLQGAKLEDALLGRTDLEDAVLWRAGLDRVNFEGALLRSANISDTNLTSAKLRNSDLKRANLEGSYLEDADLKDANLTGAKLQGACLIGADLKGATLESAVLEGVNLLRADLSRASLEEAYLDSADLRDASVEDALLRGAKLGVARLEGANLGSANLVRAKLQGADLRRAKLRSADLGDADLRGAKLESAELEGAKLESAKLEGADLKRAKLRSADLRDADLRGAEFEGADLEGADLGGADLARADLSTTEGIKPDQLQLARNVTWPDDVPRPTEGRYSDAWEAKRAVKLRRSGPSA